MPWAGLRSVVASRDDMFLLFLLVQVYARCSVDIVEQRVILYSGKEGVLVTWVWGSYLVYRLSKGQDFSRTGTLWMDWGGIGSCRILGIGHLHGIWGSVI